MSSEHRQRSPERARALDDIRVRAVVASVNGTGQKRFVVTYPQGVEGLQNLSTSDSITFSLDVWQDTLEPFAGQVVILEGVRLAREGWRATSALPITPLSNEQEQQQ